MPFINRCGGGGGKSQGFVDVLRGITSYNSVIEINGESRSNLLVSPSKFTDDNENIVYSSSADAFFKRSFVDDSEAENGIAMYLEKASQAGDSLMEYAVIPSILSNAVSKSRRYFACVKLKTSFNTYAVSGYKHANHGISVTFAKADDSTSVFRYAVFPGINQWITNGMFLDSPEGYYLSGVGLLLPTASTKPKYYIDWMGLYDMTGIDIPAYGATVSF